MAIKIQRKLSGSRFDHILDKIYQVQNIIFEILSVHYVRIVVHSE